MRGNLIKAPLVAVIYASLLQFIAVFLPFTAFYGEAAGAFAANQIWLDYVWLVVYCLFVCIIAAIAFAGIDKTGIGAFLRLLPIFLGLLWALPMLESFLLGEMSGLMSFWDLLMRFAQVAVGTAIMLFLCTLLYTKKYAEDEAAEPAPKDKAKVRDKPKGPRKFKIVKLLLLMMLALPFAFFLLYFVGGYFLAWRNEIVRVFYNGGDDGGFFFMLIVMLVDHIEYAGIALLRGLLSTALSFLLMLRLLPGKKRLFIILNVMFYFSQALLYIIPAPAMAWEVRLPHLISSAVVFVLFGGVSAFILPLAYNKNLAEEPAELPPELPKGKKPTAAGTPIPPRQQPAARR